MYEYFSLTSSQTHCFIQKVDDFFIVHYQTKLFILSAGDI